MFCYRENELLAARRASSISRMRISRAAGEIYR